MKKFYSILLLVIVICFSASAGRKTIVNNKLQIPKCTSAPTIDGILDPVWKNVTAIPLLKWEGGPVDSALASYSDHFTTFRTMWDADNFYVFVHVVDDTISTGDAGAPWNDDAVEIFFDGTNSKATAYDSLCVQWRWVYGKTVDSVQLPISGGFRGPGTWAWKQTVVGYNLELQLPAAQLRRADTVSQLFALTQDTEIGFEISNADRDNDVVGRKAVKHWWATNGLTWSDPSLFGTAVLTGNEVSDKLQIVKTSTPPVIDGVMDAGEWDNANEITLEKFEGFENDSLMLKDQADHFTTAFTMWDANNFYVFVKVTDDSISTGDAGAPWNDDCVEVFFDGTNSKATAYDSLCVQWRWVYGKTVDSVQLPISGGFRGPGTWAWAQTATGYNFELQIPAAQLRRADTVSQLFALTKDTEIGFEISNADRDNDVVGRTNVRHWWAWNGLTWSDPSLFGTAVLFDPTATGVSEKGSSVISEYRLMQNYPNPFNPSTEISYSIPKSEKVKLTVYNLLGKQVAELVNGTKSAGSYTVSFSAANLSSGVYFYKLETGSTVLAKKMLLLK